MTFRSPAAPDPARPDPTRGDDGDGGGGDGDDGDDLFLSETSSLPSAAQTLKGGPRRIPWSCRR